MGQAILKIFVYVIPAFIVVFAIDPLWWPPAKQPEGLFIGGCMIAWAVLQCSMLSAFLKD
jgi:hypothetical protein